ncbi:MAG: S-adenosylmethionine:tRNA-ribosyltransferase-isomerase [Thermodesulfobacterium sp.]|uniref:S-adenosylmethionine:tRNA ribosyltransferase-isomerase n=1 Tax=Candidatus Thermodesulfobacterium syntrophicum TaxID=3060442 RepID=A0AAE3TER6_9BACT|nr:S-adenosylmethionine:tRNA-ribosyltransferase-isomerase [Candidatus Thermodesulfobacterium syntrophicum]
MSSISKEFDIETYDYELPEELIAYYPTQERTQSRLLVIDRKTGNLYFHEKFSEIKSYFKKGDLLILNNTKVFPARLKGKKLTGGEADLLLFQKPRGKTFETHALIKGKRIRKGTEIRINDEIEIKVLEKYEGGRFLVELKSKDNLENLIYKYGKAPLPPYIKREPEDLDLQRYQTIYAEKEGSIAAPTAGFHFDEKLLTRLKEKGVIIKYITLHVGYGTFAPIKVRDIRKHKIEPEYIEVEEDVISEIKSALLEKRRIVAVGTTVVRTLEFIAQKEFNPYKGLCDLYIYPSFKFRVVSAMITNFHLPKSSLLLLVCAFAGKDLIFRAYKEAIKRKYRFYSYGDATFII